MLPSLSRAAPAAAAALARGAQSAFGAAPRIARRCVSGYAPSGPGGLAAFGASPEQQEFQGGLPPSCCPPTARCAAPIAAAPGAGAHTLERSA